MPMPGPDDMRRLNPSSAPRWDSCQGDGALPTPMDKAIDNDDRLWREQQHQRRLTALRMHNDLARKERQFAYIWITAVVLGVLAFALL